MKKMLLLVNPVAGKKKVNRYIADIVTLFNRAQYDVLVYFTECAGDARKKILQLAQGVDLVVCCGGDGTFNETVSGVLDSGIDIPIGYIPAGSTNDFATTLNLPVHPVQAAEKILSGTPVAIDVGQFEDRKFTYIASFGAFTKVSYSTPQTAKNNLGHTAYVLEGINELSQIREVPVKILLDGESLEGEYFFGAICNCTSVAGVLKLNPDRVDLQDGLFEVLLIRPPKDLAELTGCMHAISTQTYDHPMITFCSARDIVVEMDEELDWSLDGEYMAGKPRVHIENLHRAVKVVL